MAHEDYNNIELTEEETAVINDGLITEIETTASQNEEPVEESADAVQSAETDIGSVEESTETEASTTEETEVEVEDDFDGFEIDGQRFDREDVLAWRDDSSNKADWSKSNTEKAQQLSKWNKLAEKINGDDTFRDHIKDFFFDDPEATKALGLDGDVSLPVEVEEAPEIPSEFESRLDVLEKIEGERVMEHRVDQLDGTLTNLEKQYPDILGDQAKVGEFLEFADRNAEKFVESGMPNLERAFREWSYGQLQEQLSHYKKLDKNGARNKGKVIGTAQVGAKEVKSPKKYAKWNDVSMDDPEIAKYFDD